MKNRRGSILLILLAVSGIAAGALWFSSKIHIPFVETKADVQKKLDIEKQEHKATAEELKGQQESVAKQKKLIEDKDIEKNKQAALTQTAANAVAKITAVDQLIPPVTRKDKVIDNAAQEAAKALPPPTDFVATLKIVQDQLDELKTSNAQLQSQHENDMGTISQQKIDLAAAAQLVRNQQEEVTRQQKLNDQQKAENDRKGRLLDDKEGIINKLLMEFDRLKYSIMGLVGLAGALCIGAGALVNNKLLIAKGVILAVLAICGMIIPVVWYLGTVAVAFLVVAGYIASQWHKEKSIADNAVGILGELKQKAPEAWNEHVKPIAASYWGTSVKDVAKADAWVGEKLDALNLLPKTK